MCKCIKNLKNLIFHVNFLNMDISIIIALICLKICMCISEICMEGSMSQNFDLGLSFCYVEDGVLGENTKKRKSYPFFITK